MWTGAQQHQLMRRDGAPARGGGGGGGDKLIR
jgi:hypothetical protein